MGKSSSVFYFILFFCFSSITYGQYWQQEVEYRMDIDFNVEDHRFSGYQSVMYINHSPDTLHTMFYHLYLNAFQPGSMMDQRSQSIIDSDKRVADRISKLSPGEYGYQRVLSLKQDGKDVIYEVKGTILKVTLGEPILPNQSVMMEMKFDSQVPLQIRRTGRDNAEGIAYTMTQWYPKICAYDTDGWHPNQYVAREFYGNWGDFYVNITMDGNYYVVAGGELINEKKGERMYRSPTELVKLKSSKERKTWRFVAKNVHDFAWAADPDFVHTSRKIDENLTINFFYQLDTSTTNLEAWEKLPQIMETSLPFMEEHFGAYPYPVYNFIQGGDGGMEYPMCTMITGRRSLRSLVGVSLHEWMHSWYQMMMATDEAQYAWMDEGFTSYADQLTQYYLQDLGVISGTYDVPFGSVMNRFIQFAELGFEEPMNIHSDYFQSNAAYSIAAYVKGAVYLHMLNGIIGDEAFHQTMLGYYNKWKFKHPKPEDFIRIAEKKSGIVLDWFHNLMNYSTYKSEYGIEIVDTLGSKKLLVTNKGNFPMPLDIVVYDKKERMYYINIPLLSMYGKKPLPGIFYQELQLKPWKWTQPTYLLDLPISYEDVKAIYLDPALQVPDTHRENNQIELEE